LFVLETPGGGGYGAPGDQAGGQPGARADRKTTSGR